MIYRHLGKSQLRVSVLGLGGMQLGGPITRNGRPCGLPELHEGTEIKILEKAVKNGINFIDTARHYGRSEAVIGSFLKKYPDSLTVCSKCGIRPDKTMDISGKYIEQSVSESLEALQSDSVDIYLVTLLQFDPARVDEAIATLQHLKQKGLIRYLGASVKRVEDAEYLINTHDIDVIEVPYNIFNVNFGISVMSACKAKQIGVIVKSPLNTGVLSGKIIPDTRFHHDDSRRFFLNKNEISIRNQWVSIFCEQLGLDPEKIHETALRFVASNQNVSTMAVGMRSIVQLEQNINIIEETLFDDTTCKKIEAYSMHSKGGFNWNQQKKKK